MKGQKDDRFLRAKRWRDRAEELRAVSHHFSQPRCRVSVLELAQCFEDAAEHIEAAHCKAASQEPSRQKSPGPDSDRRNALS